MSTIRMMGHVLWHPFDFFDDLQEPGRAKWFHPALFVLLACVAKMLSIVLTGYAFQTWEPYEISWVQEWVWLIVPWFSWCVANWAVSTILEGEGKFKEIIVGSSFALVPYILFIVPITLLTHVIGIDENSIYVVLNIGIFLWVAWLILVKVRVLHDFEIGKTIWIVVLTLLGIAIIWFIGILLYGLANQFIQFVLDLGKELKLRS